MGYRFVTVSVEHVPSGAITLLLTTSRRKIRTCSRSLCVAPCRIYRRRLTLSEIGEYSAERWDGTKSGPVTRTPSNNRTRCEIYAQSHVCSSEGTQKLLPYLTHLQVQTTIGNQDDSRTFVTALCVPYASAGLIVIAPRTHLSKPSGPPGEKDSLAWCRGIQTSA